MSRREIAAPRAGAGISVAVVLAAAGLFFFPLAGSACSGDEAEVEPPQSKPVRGILLFESRSDIFTRRLPDGRPVLVAGGPGVQGEPSWGPRGQEIAYVDRPAGNEPQALLVRERDGKTRRLLRADALGAPGWSPDGRMLAFSSTQGSPVGWHYIWTISADGRRARKLSSVSGMEPTWAPDGQWIAFTHLPGEIWIVRKGGGGERAVHVDYSAPDREPAWSPDGKRIAFTRGWLPAGEIWVMDRDGANRRRLTPGPSDHSPVWSPDGDEIAFSRSNRLFVVSVRSGSIRSLRTAGVNASWIGGARG